MTRIWFRNLHIDFLSATFFSISVLLTAAILQADPQDDPSVTTVSIVTTNQNVEAAADLPSTDIVKEVAPDFTFAVWDTEGKICILAKFSATFTITYPSTGGEQIVSVNLPEDARSKGRCGTVKQEPALELSWPGFRLSMIFKTVRPKDKVNPDSWELMSIELLYDTASPLFDAATNAGKKTARSQEEEWPLFSTPYGKSYFCPSPDVIPMFNTKKEKAVLARLQDAHLQVYGVQKGKFSQFQRCSLVRIGGMPEPFAQDETVPIAVGSTLTVMAVLVVIGYALFRSMMTKKTEYSYME